MNLYALKRRQEPGAMSSYVQSDSKTLKTTDEKDKPEEYGIVDAICEDLKAGRHKEAITALIDHIQSLDKQQDKEEEENLKTHE